MVKNMVKKYGKKNMVKNQRIALKLFCLKQ